MIFHMVEDMYILYSTILFVESVVLCRYRDITGTGIWKPTGQKPERGHDWNVWRPCFADFAQMIFR